MVIISVSYLFEGKVAEHLKKHWGKYATVAAAAAAGVAGTLAEPEVTNQYHKSMIDKLKNDITSDSTNLYQKVDKGVEILKHADKAIRASQRSVLNR